MTHECAASVTNKQTFIKTEHRNISSHSLEFLWQPEKNQKKKVVFPERREGGIVVLTERSEVKTVPPERREGKTFF